MSFTTALKSKRLPHIKPLMRILRFLRTQLPPVNFITLHYAYFIITCMVSSIIFWGSSTPAHSVRFIDSFFLCVSAMSLAGLNTINLSTLNSFQQVMLFLLIMMGSAIFVSAFTVEYRRRVFLRRFQSILDAPAARLEQAHPTKEQPWPQADGNDERAHPTKERPWPQADVKEEQADAGVSLARISTNDRPLSFAPVEQAKSEHTITDAAEANAPQQQSAPINTLSVVGDHGPQISFSPDTRFGNSPQDPSSDAAPVKPRRSIISISGVGTEPATRVKRRRSIISMTGVGAEFGAALEPTMSHPQSLHRTISHQKSLQPTTPYFHSHSGFIARNSSFHNLTTAERETLGGVEYRALHWLAWIVPAYYVLWQLFGAIGIAAYVALNRPDSARENGLNPWWVGAFNAVSAFNNSGMSLLDANMTVYQTAYYMIITMSLLILAGNTCYPIFLRLIIWTIHRYMPASDRLKVHRTTLKFLLDHPRRCYTNMFPSRHTWWLLMAVVTLNGIDWAGFEILNIGSKTLTLSAGVRAIDGLFQAFAVRSGGFYIVPIPTLRISLQILYVVMMYISVYPVVITMRNSNVYEERSLGIYSSEVDTFGPPPSEHDGSSVASTSSIGRPSVLSRARHHLTAGMSGTKSYFVRTQIRAQLAHDIWIIVLAVFVIAIVESSQFERDPATFSAFNIIFEVVSAYGTVGISVGVPNAAYSFCGDWHSLSKLVLCGVMLRGRHRGLPVAIDKAVILPRERDVAGWAEEEDAMIRAERARAGLTMRG